MTYTKPYQRLRWASFIALAGLAAPALAVDDTFTVSVEVLSSCTVTADDLDFGNYDGTEKDAQSNLTINCTGATDYQVALDGGEAADTANRVMSGDNNAGSLSYQLYQDGSRSTVFGLGADDVDQTGIGSNQTVVVYGRIPASQTLIEDTYDDVVTVSVTY